MNAPDPQLAHHAALQHHTMVRALLDGSAEALVLTSTELCVLHANPAARELLGSAVASGAVLTLASPLALDQTREVGFSDAAGRRRTVELRVSATWWDDKAALLVALHDVGERRAAEQVLQIGRSALEASAHGIAIADATDLQLPLIYVNPAFERITGYSRGEALGRGYAFLLRGDVDQPEILKIRDALAQGQAAHAVVRNYRKDGTLFWNDLSVSPVRDGCGAVTHFICIQNDVSERRQHEAHLLWQSTHDTLTGLPNRTLLLQRMQETQVPPADGDRPAQGHVAALLVDLDHFMEVNSSLGHEAGDRLLLEVVARLKDLIREGDTLARVGGDEFVVLLPGLADAQHAARVAERVLRAVARPYFIADQTVYCGCSIGVAVTDATRVDPAELLREAGLAVHAAKRAGRNAVRFYSGDLVQRVVDRLEMRALLQGAIGQYQGFEVHYQPQLDLHSGRISGMEALVRWRHPEAGAIEPGRFIPVAEETGQIVPIGAWVLEHACRQHLRWIDKGVVDCAVAVNVSGVQLQRDGFVETVAGILQRTGLPPNRLELELTESVTMETGGKTLETLHRLRALGVALAIDDFGTGFSSLGYLKRLPIDKVKIDRSFIKDVTHDSGDSAITLSVIAIAHHLRMRVVAEGVETPAQLAYLKRHLCDNIQGYLVSRPLPATDMDAFLAGFQHPVPDRATEVDDPRPTLLLVDDEPNILRALTRTLRRDGYRILTADGAAGAFEILAQHDVQVILSDQRMPHTCGTEFLSEVKNLYPRTVRMVLSGYTDLQSVTEAINRGAIYRFLTKPWEDDDLRAHVKEAFLHQQRQTEAGAWG